MNSFASANVSSPLANTFDPSPIIVLEILQHADSQPSARISASRLSDFAMNAQLTGVPRGPAASGP
jgi:hypothetical protein